VLRMILHIQGGFSVRTCRLARPCAPGPHAGHQIQPRPHTLGVASSHLPWYPASEVATPPHGCVLLMKPSPQNDSEAGRLAGQRPRSTSSHRSRKWRIRRGACCEFFTVDSIEQEKVGWISTRRLPRLVHVRRFQHAPKLAGHAAYFYIPDIAAMS